MRYHTPHVTTPMGLLTVLLASTAPFGAAHAQGRAAQELPPITVTTVTSPTLVPTPENQVASSISVVTGAQLERDQRRTLTDAISALPGLNIVQQGGPGNLTNIFIRGTNSNHTKVLIDGIDVGDPSTPNGAYDLSQITTADIERIEVLRGPQSGLYGSDAIGGVVSITTKKGEGPPKVTAMIEGGSRETFNGAAGISGSQDRFNYAFNVSNFYTGSTPVTPRELLAPGVPRNNDSNRNTTASTRLGYDFSEMFGVNFVARYTDSTLRFTTDDFVGPTGTRAKQDAQQFFTRGEAVVNLFDGRFKNYFGVNYSDFHRFTDDPNGGFPGPATTTTNGDRLKYDWRGVISVLPGQTVVLGAEHENERFDVRPQFTPFISAERGNTAGFAEWQSNFNNIFFLTSNVRVDDNETFGTHTTYRVAPAVIVPGSETKLKASYGTGFKAPQLNQLFDTTFGSNNPNLKPEESRGYDVGFEQPLFNNRVRFGTTYYRNDIENLINFGPFFVLENINRARTDGFETFVAITFNERFSVRFDHTITHAIDVRTGLELLRRPENKASVTAIWKPIDDLTLSATAIAVGDFADIERAGFPRVRNPGYTIVNLAANYTIAPGITTFARIDNLFDEKYQNPTGFLNPRFGVFGGIRFASR